MAARVSPVRTPASWAGEPGATAWIFVRDIGTSLSSPAARHAAGIKKEKKRRGALPLFLFPY